MQECDLEEAWNQRHDPLDELSWVAAGSLNWNDFIGRAKRELTEDDC